MTSIDSRRAPAQRAARMLRLAACALFPLAACSSSGRNLDLPDNEVGALLERSIVYHDPGAVWGRETMDLVWTSTQPDREIGYMFEVEMKPNGDFGMFGVRASAALEYHVEAGVMRASVDGQDTFSDEVRERMGLVREDGLFWRNYIGFLASLPMCLAEPGVQLDLPLREAEIDGQAVLAFDVEFAPDVGKDIYTFYFEPETARLVGCRFYNEDPTKDGEMILFEGESQIGGLLLPATRRWYTNVDSRFLGSDEVRANGLE